MFAAIEVRSDITMTSVSDDSCLNCDSSSKAVSAPGAQVDQHRVEELAGRPGRGAFDGAHHLHAIAARACVGYEGFGERSIVVDDQQ